MENIKKSKNITGKNIKKAREERGISQKDFASILQVKGIATIDNAALCRIESGERSVLDYELKIIAKALNVSADELLEADGGHQKS